MSGMPPARPRTMTYTPENWDLLASFWHPVLYESDLGTTPVAVRLLDQRLVVYRASGQVVVANDVCVHRGAPLSGGHVDGETLVCPYHGLRFDSMGACVAIPQAGPGAVIPGRLRLSTYPVVLRYGIIWTCLRPEPLAPLPEWPGMEDPATQKVNLAVAEWACSAFRHVENFNDVGHFSFVHAGTFGNPDDPIIARHKVETTASGLFRRMPVSQVDRDTFQAGPEATAIMQYDYRYTLPFASSLTINSPDGRTEYIYDAVSPVSATKSRIFIVKARDYDLGQPVDDWIRFQQAVNEEDRWIVEAQHPEEIPMDLKEEAHIFGDAWSIAFRRRWAELGYTDH